MAVMKIFTGPPGTGKTRQAKHEAVRLLTAAPVADEHVQKRYEELVKEKRILFVTFHPSYSYEDFVEGFRPLVEDGRLVYRVVDGPFLDICRATGESFLRISRIGEFDPLVNFPLKIGQQIGAGNRYTVEEIDRGGVLLRSPNEREDNATETQLNYVAFWYINYFRSLGVLPQELSIAGKDYNKKREFAAKTYLPPAYTGGSGPVRALYEALHGHFTGTTRVRPKGPAETLASELAVPSDPQYSHAASSETTPLSISGGDIGSGIVETRAAHETSTNSLAPQIDAVLIIDEINRADLSKVFGELLTVIEPDKRLGGQSETGVKLTYSRSELKVPSGLHILGAMNTTDKSLSVFDLALRRRFTFVDVAPNPELCAVTHELDLKAFLRELNRRIQVLRGPEFRLGHSDFMPDYLSEVGKTQFEKRTGEDAHLRAAAYVLRSKTLPMLEEHCQGDRAMVNALLSGSQLYSREDAVVIPALAEYLDGGEEGGRFTPNPTHDPTSSKWDGNAFRNSVNGVRP